MSALDLAQSLSAIWYVNDSENNSKEPIVERREVKSLFVHYFINGEPLSSIFDCINDNSTSCEVDESINVRNKTINEAFDDMQNACNKKGHLTLEDVIQSQLDAQEFDEENDYADLCHRLGTALNIDTSDSVTNTSYWNISYQGGLTPIQAVKSSLALY
jgi:hypothetical protein